MAAAISPYEGVSVGRGWNYTDKTISVNVLEI